MSAAQRVSRGFHRLGIFLAAIPLLISGFISVKNADWTAPWSAKGMSWTVAPSEHEAECQAGSKLACLLAEDEEKQIQIKGFGTVPMPHGFDQSGYDRQDAVNKIVETNWRNEFLDPLLYGLGVTLAASLAVYGLIRAIGWVIGGFATSA